MPICETAHDVSLHYITNTPKGNATDLDHSKPTILLLPPMFTDVILGLREQFKDPRLSHHYNLIAFDQRNMGLTKAPFCKEQDGWVDAADLAVAHELLRLPPCHIFAANMNSGAAAQRFAILFPEKCLSLCLCSSPIQPKDRPKELSQGFVETIYAWCFPKDLEDVERACLGLSWYAFTGQVSLELEDEVSKLLFRIWVRLWVKLDQVVAYWQMNLPPTKRTSFLAQSLITVNRSQLSDEEINAIKQPTMLLQGEKSVVSPPKTAQEFCNKLRDGHLCAIKGGPELMNIVPEYSSIINRLYHQFLGQLPNSAFMQFCNHTPPDPRGVCENGLARLSMFAHDPSIAHRDPSTSLSFSRLSAEEVEKNSMYYAEFSEGEKCAFRALDENGLPLRKFSERHVDDWNPDAFQRHYMTAQVLVSQRTLTQYVD